MFCIKCGQELPSNAKYCFKSGQELPDISSQDNVLNANILNNNNIDKTNVDKFENDIIEDFKNHKYLDVIEKSEKSDLLHKINSNVYQIIEKSRRICNIQNNLLKITDEKNQLNCLKELLELGVAEYKDQHDKLVLEIKSKQLNDLKNRLDIAKKNNKYNKENKLLVEILSSTELKEEERENYRIRKEALKPIIDNIRRIKVIFVLLAVVAFFVSIVVLLPLLNKKYFSSWDEYNYASRSQKESAIATALNDFDSRLINNKSKMNVAFMLDADDVLPKLEKALNTSNFKDVFSKGIPILYYIFSPELLKTAPNSIREQALKFLIAFPKYEFSIGEELFRKYLKKHFQRERYKFWDLAFSENGNNNESKAEEINEMMWPFSRVLHDRELSANAWLDNDPDVSFNFALFKKLSVDEQAAVIKQALINLVVNKNGKLLDEKENKEIETFIETWSQKGSMLIYYYPLISYKDETEISEIVFAALKLISNELNNGLSGFNLDTFINKNDSNSEKSGESAQ